MLKKLSSKVKSKMAAVRTKCHAPWSFFRQFSSDFHPIVDNYTFP